MFILKWYWNVCDLFCLLLYNSLSFDSIDGLVGIIDISCIYFEKENCNDLCFVGLID